MINNIGFLCLPFHELIYPSISLTQLKMAVEKRFDKEISVDVLYLNHVFGKIFTPDVYRYIGQNDTTQIGDWLFRHIVFPNEKDNLNTFLTYLKLHYDQEKMTIFQNFIEPLRKKIDKIIYDLIIENELHKKDMIGFSSYFSQNLACFAFAKKIKELNPNVIIVMGGSNCEYPMGLELIKRIDHVDYIFSGNSITSLLKFIENINAGNEISNDHIDGIFSKRNCNDVLDTDMATDSNNNKIKPYGEIDNINDFEILNYDSYLESISHHIPDLKDITLFLETSKGCWWAESVRCTFCGLHGNHSGYCYMNEEKARQYISKHLEKYGSKVKKFHFVDNVLPKNYIKEVFPFINVPSNVSFVWVVRVNLDENDFKVLKDFNVEILQPGIEALDNSTLKLMSKGTTAIDNITFLKRCLLFNIKPSWNLLVGSPFEEACVFENYENLLPALKHFYPPNNIITIRFDRYSKYFTNPEKYNLKLEPNLTYSFVYPFDKQALKNIAYFFLNMNTNENAFNLQKWLPIMSQIINKWKSSWNSKAPFLEIRKNSKNDFYVYDSRENNVQEYHLNEMEKLLLDTCDQPILINKITSSPNLANLSKEEIDHVIDDFVCKKWLLKENNRILSLVINKMRPN